MLQSDDPNVADWAEWVIGRIGPSALVHLEDRIEAVPRIITAIGHFSQIPPHIRAAFFSMFSTASPRVRREILGAFPRNALTFYDVLFLLDGATDSQCTLEIQLAIGLISLAAIRARRGLQGPPTSKELQRALDRLAALLKLDDPWIRRRALYAAIELGSANDLLIDQLLKVIPDKVPETRVVAIQAAVALAPPSSKLIDLLRTRMEDENLDVRIAAAMAVGKLLPDAADLAALVKPLLYSKNQQCLAAALLAINECGRTNPDDSSVIESIALSGNPLLADLACRALGGLPHLPVELTRLLCSIVEAGPSHVKIAALQALGRHANRQSWLLDCLRGALLSDDETLREHAARLLVNCAEYADLQIDAVCLGMEFPPTSILAETRARIEHLRDRQRGG